MTNEWSERQVKVCINDSDDGAVLFCYDREFMKRLAGILAGLDAISGPEEKGVPSISLYCIDIKEGHRETEENTEHPIP